LSGYPLLYASQITTNDFCAKKYSRINTFCSKKHHVRTCTVIAQMAWAAA
jgi:hypothetical protein